MDEKPTFRDVGEEAQYFRHTQLTKYTHLYSITLQLKNAASVGAPVFLEPVLQVMEDADFHITHLCGSVQDPVDASGARFYDAGSDIQLTFPMAGSLNRSERGVSFRFLDPKANRRLSAGLITKNATDLAAMNTAVNHSYLEFGTVFGPGYDFGFNHLVPFDYTLERSSRFTVQIQCTSSSAIYPAATYSRISMSFIGNRYAT